MPPVDLCQLAFGDRVQHELRVVERVERAKANGEKFLILTLGNSSGQVDTEPIWANQISEGWADGVERGAVVQAIGHITRYTGNGSDKRQLKLTGPLRRIPPELVRLEEFLPRVDADPVKLWDALDRARGEVRSRTLHRVLGLFFEDDDFRLRFERVPASINGHHSKLGGLLLHVAEVTHIARAIARTSKADMDLVIAGTLLHDIGKTETYELGPGGFTRTPCGYLIEHVVLGALMLERRVARAGEGLCSEPQLMELQHLILSHHGSLEFGSPVRPLTLEAEIVHWADEASAKANDLSESMEDPDAFGEDGQFAERKRLWRVDGRKIWRRAHVWE